MHKQIHAVHVHVLTHTHTHTLTCQPDNAAGPGTHALLEEPSPPFLSGYIRLELPVFHIGYFKNTVQILQAVCKGCAHVLLNEEERRQFLRWVGGWARLPGRQ